MTLGFQVADHGLDRGAASQLALDDAKHAALLTRDEDAARVLRVMTAIPFIDIAAFDGTGVGGDDGDLDAELLGRAGFAFGDALSLWGVEGIELPATLAVLLGADLEGARQREGKRRLDPLVASDLAADVADQPA